MVTVVGLGFMGLTTALGFAEYGHRVYGLEADESRMAVIQSGRLPFLEAHGVRVPEQLGVANNPEFLREGRCWEDFTHADRIVLGVSDARWEAALRRLYARERAPVCCVSLNTGEFIKYLSNTSLACLISCANEMSMAADAIGGIDTAAFPTSVAPIVQFGAVPVFVDVQLGTYNVDVSRLEAARSTPTTTCWGGSCCPCGTGAGTVCARPERTTPAAAVSTDSMERCPGGTTTSMYTPTSDTI